MSEKVLFVDDEISLLEGMKRNLRKQYDVYVAEGGDKGLSVIENDGPFPVVVSDMRMPGMDGAQFLSAVRERNPDTVRILLTGQPDVDSAIAAVNHGRIFRFLTKPCSTDDLIKIIDSGIEQYRLIKAEQELLEETLKGSIKVLTEILSLTNPAAFSRAMRIKHYVEQIAIKLKLNDTWQYEIAAMLSQIGCVTVPSETMEKCLGGEKLSDSEIEMVKAHPAVAGELIKNIPRLEHVAAMIASQAMGCDQKSDSLEQPELVGGQILKAAIDFDAMLETGSSILSTLQSMRQKPRIYNSKIVNVLKDVKVPTLEMTVQVVQMAKLRNGMLLAEDVRSHKDVLIVAKGQEVNEALRRQMENFVRQRAVPDSVRVYVRSPG